LSTAPVATPVAAPPISRLGVQLLAWPAEDATRRVLAANRIPRLLLIAHDCAPPVVIDSLEDWIRDPIDSLDLDARVRALAQRAGNAARLLAAVDDASSPSPAQDRSSWIVDDADIERLSSATQPSEPELEPPTCDRATGVVRHGSRWVAVSERQLPVAAILVDRFRSVVTRAELVGAYAQETGSTDPAALKSMTLRLGHRLAEIGLVLRTVRGRGYVLERARDGG
jgi:DNA-binding response OmpR family regulator